MHKNDNTLVTDDLHDIPYFLSSIYTSKDGQHNLKIASTNTAQYNKWRQINRALKSDHMTNH